MKIALSKDPFFYLNREDLLELLTTHDDKMITHLIEINVKLLIQEEISYKLVGIKDEQVDKNQMTTLKLIDFIQVLVDNKRVDLSDNNSPVLFSHSYILKFLKFHAQFIKEDEVLKILILQRRFRLTL